MATTQIEGSRQIKFNGDMTLSNNKITNLGTGAASIDNSLDAVNKEYVDSVASGLDVKASVRMATAAAFSTYTQAGAGIGATLTVDAAEGAISVDGITGVSGDRILVKDGAANSDNGIYTITTLGDGSTAWVLTRATDADEDTTSANGDVSAGMFMFVEEGSVNDNFGYVLTTNNDLVIDTTDQAFSRFSALSGDNVIDREDFATQNGTIVAFVLANVPTTGSEHVYLNGVLQDDGSEDYTLSDATTITFLTAPLTDDKLTVSYRF